MQDQAFHQPMLILRVCGHGCHQACKFTGVGAMAWGWAPILADFPPKPGPNFPMARALPCVVSVAVAASHYTSMQQAPKADYPGLQGVQYTWSTRRIQLDLLSGEVGMNRVELKVASD